MEDSNRFGYCAAWMGNPIPGDHPLVRVGELTESFLVAHQRQIDRFAARHGRRPVPFEQCVRALVLQALYSIPNEKLLCEHIRYNLLFRWFCGVSPLEPLWESGQLVDSLEGYRGHGLTAGILGDLSQALCAVEPVRDGSLCFSEKVFLRWKDAADKPAAPVVRPKAEECELHRISAEHEHDLIRRAKRGEPHAFEELFSAYQPDAFRFAMSFLGNEDDALEASQEAFLKAFSSLSRFDSARLFFPGLYRILRSHCMNILMHRQHKRKALLEELLREPGTEPDEEPLSAGVGLLPDSKPGPDDLFAGSETRDQLWRAIEKLRPDFREVVIMRHFHNLTCRQIAESLNVSTARVIGRLQSARQELRELMTETTV